MDTIYFFVTSCKYYKDDYQALQVFKTYFFNQGGFTEAFWIAVISALVMAFIYYILIGFISKKLSNLGIWIAALVIALCASFFITDYNTGMSRRNYGLSTVIENRYSNVGGSDSDYVAEYTNMKKDFKKGIVKVTPVRRLCETNVIITLVFFAVTSLVFCYILPAKNYARNYPIKLH